jgi:hypothetical protein
MKRELTVQEEQDLRRHFLFRPCDTREELRQWLISYLGLDLPDCMVDQDSTSTPLDMVWTCYSKMRANNDPEFNRVLFFACRDGFKTLGAAAIEVLAIVHLGRSVAHMAAIKEQAKKAQSYVKKSFRRPYLRDFVIGDNETETKIVRFYNPKTKHNLTTAEYEALTDEQKGQHEEISRTLTEYREREDYVKIIICTMQGANSEHVPLMIIDEVDVVTNPAAYAEAQNIPSERAGKLDLTILTSTRKFAFGLVQDEINRKEETGLHVFHWNLIDITQPCPSSRHQCGDPNCVPGSCKAAPTLPIYRSDDTLKAIDEKTLQGLSIKEQSTYVKDFGYSGCLINCKLFSVCKTRLATHQTSKSTFLNKISTVINKFKRQRDIDMAKAQLLCRKPASTGLIYGRFERMRHVLSPAQAFARVFGHPPDDFADGRPGKMMTKAEFLEAIQERDVSWYGAMDFGSAHNYVYVHGFKDGQRMFVTNVFSSPGLGTDQQVAQVERYRGDAPRVYGDTEDPQSVRIFKKAGWNMMKWKKGPGSLRGGITAVQAKLNPVFSDEPELFFVHDVDEDPGMALMVKRMQEYHWMLDAAGRPTDVPTDDEDDEVDALRYLVMNVFPMKGSGLTAGNGTTDAGAAESISGSIQPTLHGGYDPNNWVRQMIQQQTGGQGPAQRPRMTIEAPSGSGYTSYYADDAGDIKEISGKKARQKAAEDQEQEAPGAGRAGRLIWDIG